MRRGKLVFQCRRWRSIEGRRGRLALLEPGGAVSDPATTQTRTPAASIPSPASPRARDFLRMPLHAGTWRDVKIGSGVTCALRERERQGVVWKLGGLRVCVMSGRGYGEAVWRVSGYQPQGVSVYPPQETAFWWCGLGGSPICINACMAILGLKYDILPGWIRSDSGVFER